MFSLAPVRSLFAAAQTADDAVERVLNAFMAERAPIYVVGGAVRDHLLGISAVPGWSYQPAPQRGGVTTTDLDLTFAGPVLPVARRVADRLGWAFYPLDAERDVARLIGTGADGQRLECDVAALRGDLRADLFARDFSANALALKFSVDSPPQLIDVCGGGADVEARRLCRITPDSLRRDPIRLLRAIRLSAQLGFTIEDQTRAQIKAGAATILLPSVERVRDELWKLLDSICPDAGIEELRALGLLTHLLPEIEAMQGVAQSPPHHLNVYDHSLLVMNYAAELRNWLRGGPPPADEPLTQMLTPWTDALRAHFAAEVAAGHDRAGWLVWHGLFHDTGKPGSRSVAIENGVERTRFCGHEQLSARLTARRIADLHFSRREILLAERVAAAHVRPRQLFLSLTRPAAREKKGESERSLPPVWRAASSAGAVSRQAAFRFFRDIGSVVAGHHISKGSADSPFDGLDVALQAIADRQATGLERGEKWRRFLIGMGSLLAYAFSRPASRQAPLVDGHILMKHLGLSPGPAVGTLLRELTEAQAAGELSSVEEALALAEELHAAFKRADGL